MNEAGIRAGLDLARIGVTTLLNQGEAIGSEAMWSLPWSNIPTLLVPFYLVTHGIIYAKLAWANRVAVV